ncbi:MAG: phospho-sugar mutase [Eubacteriales bacterium]
MEYLKRYEEWLNGESFDKKTKEELLEIKDDEDGIKERFYKDLEFGTGGLRGVIGAGTNRMNIYTVRKATQGLANYIKKHGESAINKGVAIAYDSRRMSPEFSREAALVLCANGVKAYVFESLRPTPELSFAVRELGCIAGIVVTASHNPPEYNGYKVYWEDGAQIASPRDKEIIDEVYNVKTYEEVKVMDLEDAKGKGLYNIIGKDIDDKYIHELKKLVINQDSIDKKSDSLKIVYTPLHGTGNIPIRRILKEIGFNKVYVVPEQELPDSEFSTVGYPNPEDIKVFDLALELAEKKGADIILATDPDGDRLGVLAKNEEGKFIQLTGNMTGVLLADYIISQKIENSTFPSNGALIKTIVSTNMADAVAKYYGVKLMEVLTGFKYIGEKIKEFEETGKFEYLFGFEESYGALIGTHARDKDAVVSTMTLCEAAAYYKTKGLTLWEAMIDLYEKYGYYREELKSITLKGIEGMEKIQNILETLRTDVPTQVGSYMVVAIRDYQTGEIKKIDTGEIESTGLPKSNVLYFELNNDAWFCVRPSGTEPKIKLYFGVKGDSLEDSNKKIKNLIDGVMNVVDGIIV